MVKDQGNRSRQRRSTGDKVTLTKYYRSGKQAPDGRSPFKLADKKKNPRRFYKLLDVLAIGVLLFFLIYSLIVSPNAKVQVSSTAFQSQSKYESAVNQQLQSFKNRNKATFDDQSIAHNIQKQFPEVVDVSVELPLIGRKPTVKLSISEPSFFMTSAGKNYVIDAQGEAVGLSTELPQIGGLPVLVDQSGFSVENGKQVLSSQQVNFIKNLLTQLKAAKVPIASLTIPPLASELHLRTSDQPYYVKFYTGGDAVLQAGQYLAARNNFAKSSGPSLSEYLDVRVSGKLFYK